MKRLQYPPENEILFLKGVVNYTEFHLKNGRKEISSFTLLRHQERHSHFLRVNKSHLLNPDYINKVISDSEGKTVVLKNGNRIKVSRRRIYVLNQMNFY
jgi:two-component system LytT family response regulator